MTGPTPLARWRVVYTDTKGITHLWHSYVDYAKAYRDARKLSELSIVREVDLIDIPSDTGKRYINGEAVYFAE